MIAKSLIVMRVIKYRASFLILIFSIVSLMVFSCCKSKEPATPFIVVNNAARLDSVVASLDGSPDDTSRFIAIWSYYASRNRFDSVIVSAGEVYRDAVRKGNHTNIYYSSVYMANAFFADSRYDSTEYYLDRFFEAESSIGEPNLFYSAMGHNLAAVCAIKTRLDYTYALSEYVQAYNLTKIRRDSANLSVILSNIATIYSVREDTAGLKYALGAYRIGKPVGNLLLDSRNALQLSTLYYLHKQYDSARYYVNEAFKIENEVHVHHINKSYAHLISGLIYKGIGRPDMAESEFKMAEGCLGEDNEGIDIKLYLAYGDLMLDEGNAAKAAEYYRKGIALGDSLGNIEVTYKLLYGLYRVYWNSGDIPSSFDYYRRYVSMKDSLLNLKKEQEFSAMQINYEKSRHREQLKEKELQIVKSQRAVIAISSVVVIVVLLLIYSYILYRRRNLMYSNLARQYYNFKLRFDELQANGRNRKDSSVNENDETLYEQIEALMKEHHLYRRKDVSVTLVAEMVGSNSTYISKVINTFAAVSFPNYINNYRISEAIDIISDINTDSQLKDIASDVGYTSFSTFYRAFIKETGCSPSKYREEILKMKG